MKKVTIKDIARIAGVSRGTVDRVINNRGNVSKELEKKIIKIAADLGYEKNILASSLATNRVYQLAAVLPDPSIDPFWAFPKEGIEEALQVVKHYGVRVSYFHCDIHQKDSFVMQLDNAINHRPDAILLAPIYTHETNEALVQAQLLDIPFIMINTELAHDNVLAYIGQSSYQSGYLAGRLLHMCLALEGEVIALNLGHNLSNAQHFSDKIEGIKQYFEDQGLRDPVHCYEVDYFHDKSALQKLWESIKEKHPKLKGIFFTNSRAYHFIPLLSDKELQCLRVVGYDMIEQNLQLLKDSKVDFIINQNPVQQGYLGVMNFVNHFILRKPIVPKQYLPLDIVVKENMDFYSDMSPIQKQVIG